MPLCVCKSVVSAPAHQTLQPPDTLALGSPRAPEPPPARTWVLLQPPQLCSGRSQVRVQSRRTQWQVRGLPQLQKEGWQLRKQACDVLSLFKGTWALPSLEQESSSMDIPKRTRETLMSRWSERMPGQFLLPR